MSLEHSYLWNVFYRTVHLLVNSRSRHYKLMKMNETAGYLLRQATGICCSNYRSTEKKNLLRRKETRIFIGTFAIILNSFFLITGPSLTIYSQKDVWKCKHNLHRAYNVSRHNFAFCSSLVPEHSQNIRKQIKFLFHSLRCLVHATG